MKHATITKYQSYIDIIRKDLGLPDSLHIDVEFGTWKNKGGDATYWNHRHARIRIDKTGDHKWVIEAILHELRHIWQYHTKLLSSVLVKEDRAFVGEIGKTTFYKVSQFSYFEWMQEWKGKLYPSYSKATARTHPNHKKYMNSPWEIDARDYEKEIYRLFPNEFKKGKKHATNRLISE